MKKMKKYFDIHGSWIALLIFFILLGLLIGCCASKKTTYDTIIFEFEEKEYPYHIDNNN